MVSPTISPGEALAVIVIFIGQIATGADVFDLCAFLLAVLVVVLVRIYGLAGKVGKGWHMLTHVDTC